MQRIEASKHVNPYWKYEQAKKELPPDLTPQQYQQACQALAKRFKV